MSREITPVTVAESKPEVAGAATPFLEHIATAERQLRLRDPVLARVMNHLGPCDWRGYQREPFDSLVWSIIGQQISVKAVAKIDQRVRRLTGDPITVERVMRVTDRALREAGLSDGKTRAIRELAGKIHARELNLETLRHQTDPDVTREICRIRGIGPWTAEMFLIFGLHRLDVFSARDLGLRKAIGSLWQLPELPSVDYCAEMAETWRPWRTVAAWYLWRTVDS